MIALLYFEHRSDAGVAVERSRTWGIGLIGPLVIVENGVFDRLRYNRIKQIKVIIVACFLGNMDLRKKVEFAK